MTKKKKKDEKRSKRNQGVLEYEVFRIMQASLKSAMDAALDELFKD